MSVSVLFVDDEPHILAGLRRLLHGRHLDWSTRFVESGTEALRALEQNVADVIVSDMRMPGMDGLALLDQVSRRWPQVVRIVLSGYSEHEQALKLAGLAHQFLPKPCEIDRMIELVERGVAITEELGQPRLAAMLAPVSDLPVAGRSNQALQAELRRSDPDLDQLAAICLGDPALTAKLLKIANAPLFCPAGCVGTVTQALALLGIERLRSLSMVMGFFGHEDAALHERLELDLWYERAIGIRRLAAAIARSTDSDQVLIAQAETAAAVLDLGMLALAHVDADRYDEIFVLDEAMLCDREERAYGCSHAEVGAYLAGLWQLPLPIREAVRCHHHPPRTGDAGFDLVAICYCATALYEEVHGCSRVGIDEGYVEQIGQREALDCWRAMARDMETAS